MSLIYVAYLDYTRTLNSKCGKTISTDSGHPISNVRFMLYSILVVCCLAIGLMIYFQLHAIIRNLEWFYLCPYIWLWILVAMNFSFSVKIVCLIDSNEKHDRLTTLPCFLEGLLLSIAVATMQLLSWHLVFVFCSFILNPVRAILYSVVMIVSVVCLVVLLAVIMKVIIILISQTGEFKECFQTGKFKNFAWLEEILHLHPTVFMKDKRIDIILMISLIMLLIYAHAYSVFIFQININNSNQILNETIKFIIPKILLMMIAWFLPKLFLNPEKTWLIWWKYTGKTCIERKTCLESSV